MIPYLPTEATEKWGADPVAVGASFSCVSGFCTLLAPICAGVCHKTGRFTMLVAGLALLVASLLALGQAGSLVVADLCLSVQGLSSAAVSTATLSSAFAVFPDNTAFFMGLRECALGVGNVAGPILGGYLYGKVSNPPAPAPQRLMTG